MSQRGWWMLRKKLIGVLLVSLVCLPLLGNAEETPATPANGGHLPDFNESTRVSLYPVSPSADVVHLSEASLLPYVEHVEHVETTTNIYKPSCEVTDSCEDPGGFEAIRALHRQLDDDASGTVDVSETDEFIRDELQNPNGNERQIKAFHGSDTSISVLEMWQSWRKSEVHNWTVEETVAWLVDSVELPQYARLFHENQVDGRKLPRMAVNNNQYLSSELGIKDAISKHKLVLKAMDVVLFGPQKNHNWFKDIILAVVLIFATTIVWYLVRQNRHSQRQVQKMMKELDSLSEMQQQLDKARIEQESTAVLKQQLKEEISNVRRREQLIGCSDPDSLMIKLQEEVRFLQDELTKAQISVSSRGMGVPPQLQHWLQLTHEIELRSYNTKKAAAESQLKAAKEECEKLRRKRASFMGPFRLAHGGSIDDIDTTILKARQALSEVSHDYSERLQRWRQMERLCSFNITSNRGLVHLEALLHGYQPYVTAGSTKSVISRSGSEGTISDEDSPGSYNNMSSVASTASIPPSKVLPGNSVVMPSRRMGLPLAPIYPTDYHNHNYFNNGSNLPSAGCAGSSATGNMAYGGNNVGNNVVNSNGLMRLDDDDDELTPQAHHQTQPINFSVGGHDTSPTSRTSDPPLPPPVVSSSRGLLLKSQSMDQQSLVTTPDSGISQSTSHLDTSSIEDTNANKISSKAAAKRKGSRRRSAIMNAFRNSFTSASTLAESEDSSRGSTPHLEDDRKKKRGVFSAIKKISRGSKEKGQES